VKMQFLETFLFANALVKDEDKLVMDIEKILERNEFMKLLRENVTKKEEDKKDEN